MTTWEAENLPCWRDVVDAHAKDEPTRPTVLRGTSAEVRAAMSIGALGLSQRKSITLHDYDGRRIWIDANLAKKKLQKANHAAYAAWIPHTLLAPLEVWARFDTGVTSSRPTELRFHYFAAYRGPDGATSQLVIAVANNGKWLNSFRLDSFANADDKRNGKIIYIAYDPLVTPRKPKDAAPSYRVAPFGL